MARFSGYSNYAAAPDAPGDEPPGPEPLGWRGHGSCLFCGSPDTAWQHDLDRTLAEFRTRFDRGHVWALAQILCDDCEQHYRSGNYPALARRRADLDPGARGGGRPATPDGPDADYERSLLVQDELIALAAFCRADLRVRPLVAPDLPDGFEPVDEHTGAEWVVEVWPEEFRRSIAEARPDHDPGVRVWLLGSPWPSLTLAETFTVLWTWVERDRSAVGHDLIRGRVVEALGWTDAHAAQWLARRADPPS